MDTLAKINNILKQKGKKQSDLTAYIGIHKNNFTDWKAGRSNSYLKYISQIAEYLEVSTDYLLGNEQKEKSLSPIDDKLLDIFNSLSKEGKVKLLEHARLLRDANK